jgi:hypothetical protein
MMLSKVMKQIFTSFFLNNGLGIVRESRVVY